MGEAAGVLVIAGSALFLAGAAIAVPRVFTAGDREERLRLLEERPLAWRIGQPGYALGALLAGIGVGFLAAEGAAPSRPWLAASCVVLVVGALAWSWTVYLRATRPRDFALGRLTGGPFTTYVLLTVAGLALLGVGLIQGEWPGWTGWVTLGADALFLAVYIRSGDIPPFVFYLLLGAVGVGVL